MPNSTRKYIRREKARIRREILNVKEQENLISELYQKVLNKPKKIITQKKSKIPFSSKLQKTNKNSISVKILKGKQKSKKPASPTVRLRSHKSEASKARRANKKEKL